MDSKNLVYYVGSLRFCFIELCDTENMTATTFLEHNNVSFSKILLSRVADIIKQVVQELARPFIQIAMMDRISIGLFF